MCSAVLFLILLLAGISFAYADDDPETPWDVVTRCIAPPVNPPADWSFPGTIFMAGYAGIHAFRSDWDTARVAAFLYEDGLGEAIYQGGQISPNGEWYAVPIGEVFTEISWNVYYFVHGVRLYHLHDGRVLSLELNTYSRQLGVVRGLGAWTYEAVQWLNDETLIIGQFLLHPFEPQLQVTRAPFPIVGSSDYRFQFAPDGTRFWGVGVGIMNTAQPDTPLHRLSSVTRLAWRHDSTGFAGVHLFESTRRAVIALYNRDGERVETVFNDGANFDRRVAGKNTIGWSPDDRYFAFRYISRQPEFQRVYLIDTHDQIVIDTCLSVVSQPIWSPDGSSIAVLMLAETNLRIVIIDLENGVSYDVGRHSGLGSALYPEMLFWSE